MVLAGLHTPRLAQLAEYLRWSIGCILRGHRVCRATVLTFALCQAVLCQHGPCFMHICVNTVMREAHESASAAAVVLRAGEHGCKPAWMPKHRSVRRREMLIHHSASGGTREPWQQHGTGGGQRSGSTAARAATVTVYRL